MRSPWPWKEFDSVPTYEYVCDECGHRFERFQLMSAPPAKVCPSCGGPVRRLIGSGSGFLIRGRQHARSTAAGAGRCGHEAPCCGREERCERPPCGEQRDA